MMGSDDVNPQALKTGLQELQADVQARMKIRSQWDSMSPDQKQAIMTSPGGFSSWQSKRYNEAYVDPASSPDAPDVPAAFNSGGAYTGTAGVPIKVTNAQDYAAVPKGAQYIAPDGILRIKQ